MNIFDMAIKELEREGNLENPDAHIQMIDRAIKIRHYLDIAERNKKVARNREINRAK